MSGKTKKASPVWEFFEKIDEKQVKCKLCNDCLSYRGGTSPMLSHIRSKHPTTTPLVQQLQQSTSSQSGSSSSTETTAVSFDRKNQPSVTNYVTLQRKCNPGRTETITTLITKMIALDMLPSYMVEGKGFRKLLSFWSLNTKFLPIKQSRGV